MDPSYIVFPDKMGLQRPIVHNSAALPIGLPIGSKKRSRDLYGSLTWDLWY
jgi:hypothetical protein